MMHGPGPRPVPATGSRKVRPMPRSPVLSLTIAVLIGPLAAAAASPAPAHAQDEAAFFQGRWRGTDLTPAFQEFGLDSIEIAPCGAYFCGFVPADDGSC